LTERSSGGPTVAVLGVGHWGQNLARVFASLGALAAVCDTDEARAAEVADRVGAPVRRLEDILGDDDIDGVVIAVPAAAHAEVAERALRAGKHVFVEKPLALDVPTAEALCATADEAGRVLMVGHLLQYHPAFRALERSVRAGDLGRVQYLYSNRLNFGRFRREENILWSFAPHDVSMMLSLIGAEPTEVSAVGSTFLHEVIADVTTTHLSFPGGERAHVFVSWLHPFKEQRLVVVGDRGMAVFDDGEPWETKLIRYRHHVDWVEGAPSPSKADAEPVHVEPAEPLEVECRHFLDCIATGAVPRTDGAEGVRVLRVLQAADRSMRQAGVGDRPRDGVHPTAVVDEPVEIGAGSRIWHFSHVLAGSRIGAHCTVGQNVCIGPDVTIGDGCKIQNHVSVFPGVTLEDDVFCGPSATFTNVSNPRADVDRRAEFEPTLVGRGATIGANATIVCGNRVGAHSFVAAGAVVTSDVRPHSLVVGVPARHVGWVSHAGERLGADLVCPRTGRKYREVDGELEEIL
jgi:UDP-2-acetamido-3-amino-2,3-dideoxy-glucuronate N-acetyltransferase